MIHKITAFSTSVLLAIAILSGTGCVGISQGPSLGFLGIPIPVSPYFQDKQEDKFWNPRAVRASTDSRAR